MANELNLGFSLSLNKGGIMINRSYNGQFTVANKQTQQGTVLVTDAGMYLDLGSVTTPGQVTIQHTPDGTTANYVYVGQSGSTFPFALQPNGFVSGNWGLSTVTVKTDTGSAWVDYVVVSQ